MSDEVFWDSSLAFLFKQFDLLKEMNEKSNKRSNKNGTVQRNETTETQSYRKLSPQEIADLRAKVNK